jgi:hypothetical protein
MTYEQAKKCIGKKAKYMNFPPFTIEKIYKSPDDDMIVASGKPNWAINIDILNIIEVLEK